MLYKNTYRVETTRHQNHNYAYGIYFVTICTQKKLQWFGEIKDGVMVLNEIGKIVEELWKEIPLHFRATFLDEFVVMPNHMHGIIRPNIVETRDARVSSTSKKNLHIPTGQVLQPDVGGNKSEGVSSSLRESNAEKQMPSQSIIVRTSETRDSRVSTMNEKLPPKLGVILNQWKGSATKRIRAFGYEDFHWQPRYHDHIIRSEKELIAIRKYIRCNPNTWDKETVPWHDDAVFYSL